MRIIGSLLLTGLASLAQAQLNESDTARWQVKASLTGNVLDGNVARTLVLTRVEVTNANPRWGVSTRNEYQYGTTFKNLTENDVISYNFLYLRPRSKVYPYLMGLLETNLRRKIDLRYQAGPGVSVNLIQKPGSVVKLSVTGTYEVTRFNGSTFNEAIYDGSSSIETWRITGRIFGKHTLAEKVNVSYEFWMQQSLQERVNYRYHTEASMEIPFSRRVAFRTSLRYSYEHIELEGLKPFDLLWIFGFSYTRIK